MALTLTVELGENTDNTRRINVLLDVGVIASYNEGVALESDYPTAGAEKISINRRATRFFRTARAQAKASTCCL